MSFIPTQPVFRHFSLATSLYLLLCARPPQAGYDVSLSDGKESQAYLPRGWTSFLHNGLYKEIGGGSMGCASVYVTRTLTLLPSCRKSSAVASRQHYGSEERTNLPASRAMIQSLPIMDQHSSHLESQLRPRNREPMAFVCDAAGNSASCGLQSGLFIRRY